ncbi:MAG: C40 family peptidase [Armatimonadetes bacterium]|nr:C40 family peptidase [Armatimonadota bacterium]
MASEANSGSQRLVQVTVAPLFATPSCLAEQVTQASLAAPVELLEGRRGWARVRMADGYEGWLRAADLVPVPDGWNAPFVEIRDLWASLRPAPDFRAAPLAMATIGAQLPLAGAREGWTGIRLPNRHLAWVESHRVRAAEGRRGTDARAILRTARRFLGVPYLWGGCTPLGLDCSGFVQLVFRLHGILLPRDAAPQSQSGAPIPAAEELPADLAFFEANGKVTHVGIVLGNGRMLHAAGGDRVRTDTLRGLRYGARLLGFRRVLPPGHSTGGR